MIDPTNPDYTNTPVSPNRPVFNYAPANPLAQPCVTIITPFYNTGPVFHETAASVLRQSFQQWEWLIINDGTTDATALSVLAKYRESDPRIRVIDHPKNLGLSAARNTGFREARTSYVLQIDSDDLIEPTATEKMVWYLESYTEYSFVTGYSVGFGAQEYLWQKGFHSTEEFLQENCVNATTMVRKLVHEAVKGYDETIRDGLEDWDYWLRCAHAGYWGGTIPEYLDWYRRRQSHNDRWSNWDVERQRNFRTGLRRRYPRLWTDGFPKIQLRWPMPNATVPDVIPFDNKLCKSRPRLLMIVPWLTMGGADKFNLDLTKQLTRQGWEVTIVTTLRGDQSWLPHFARYTPDIFILQHFLHLPEDYPRFLRYLIGSRQPDVVLISNSELGYLLLPYLRAHFPGIAFVDYCHMEEEYWKNGGYPRMAVEYQEMLDMNIVSSEHLRSWMERRGADRARIRVCYTNVDPDEWRPSPEKRVAVRRELGCDDDLPLILYAARICNQKQPLVFAKTMLRLRQAGLRFMALAAGDGPDLDQLRAFVNRYQLHKQVRLLSRVPNSRIQELMQAADIFFLPSKWEGIALSIYEAMACGLAVVGADVGGQRELVTSDCGVLIPRSDEQTETQRYAEVLTDLILDPRRRIQMGQAGRARVSTHFRLNQMGKRMVHLLEEASRLQASQPRPIVSLGLGRACAAQAVEYTRLFALAESLWVEREQWQLFRSGSANVPLRVRIYSVLRRFLLPYYRTLLARNARWVVSVKDGLKHLLLREA